MAQPKAPDIPRPRKNDKEYMQLCHKYLQEREDNYALERERNTWRSAFYAVCAILLTITFALLVLLGSSITNLNF